jgi:MFS superfamily sulfate permease-like transporter
MIVWEKYIAPKGKILKLIPAPLIVVLVGVAINEILRAANPIWRSKESHLVNIPVAESIGGFISFLYVPRFQRHTNPIVWQTGLTIAIVASLETLLNIEAADDLDPYQRVTPTNRELKAQGTGNIISGLIGGLPITSVVVRTSANINGGAKTKMSAIFHGVLLLLSVAFIPVLLTLFLCRPWLPYLFIQVTNWPSLPCL